MYSLHKHVCPQYKGRTYILNIEIDHMLPNLMYCCVMRNENHCKAEKKEDIC